MFITEGVLLYVKYEAFLASLIIDKLDKFGLDDVLEEDNYLFLIGTSKKALRRYFRNKIISRIAIHLSFYIFSNLSL